MSDDETPDGEPIDTFTLWLSYGDEEAALSLDLTGWNAAMRKLQTTLGSGTTGEETK